MRPRIFRQRFIPKEIVALDKDEILFWNEDRLITRWKPIKDRKDFSSGISCYYIKDDYKISRFYDKNGDLLYHYIDIVKLRLTPDGDWVFMDLLADIVIKNGQIEVLDLDEVEEAKQDGLITEEMAQLALSKLDWLLDILNKEGVGPLSSPMDEFDNNIQLERNK